MRLRVLAVSRTHYDHRPIGGVAAARTPNECIDSIGRNSCRCEPRRAASDQGPGFEERERSSVPGIQDAKAVDLGDFGTEPLAAERFFFRLFVLGRFTPTPLSGRVRRAESQSARRGLPVLHRHGPFWTMRSGARYR